MKYIFFGAGYIGQSILQLSKDTIKNILFFVDNNRQLWESEYNGFPIYSPDILKVQNEDYTIVITCTNVDDIYTQLVKSEISESRIIKWNYFSEKIMIDIWNSEKTYNYKPMIRPSQQNNLEKILINLENGLVLGGVESWVFQISKLFRTWDINTKYLISNTVKPIVVEEICNSIEVDFAFKTIGERITISTEIIKNNTPCSIMCNFTGVFFWSACCVKHFHPDMINLIAIIHSDTDPYYNSYITMERYIDTCIVISRRMEEKLLDRGFPKRKIRYLSWFIPCSSTFVRTYSKKDHKLHIGYAGRITVTDKRCDLLWEVILKLSSQNIDFVFDIAGNGDYLDEFKSSIEKEGLSDKVHLLGFIPREHICSFWERQDIMISCSDVEGHSISQCEAMASGAVPIITDTSGARDDVMDDKNGFIVEIGNTNQIVYKICYLYEHREQLSTMGKNAHKSILEKNKILNEEKFWRNILKLEK